MPLSVVDIYRTLLPKTNCGECGFPTCLAFASMVVSEQHPLDGCPYIPEDRLAAAKETLREQYAAGKWTRRDPAEDALTWARERAASMKIEDLPERIGGEWIEEGDDRRVELPYFTDRLVIREDGITRAGDPSAELTRWERVFVYNHLAQGGRVDPAGEWKGLEAFPNTVSKIKSMAAHVEAPLVDCFSGRVADLKAAAARIGGEDVTAEIGSADLAVRLSPLPKVPVLLLFWEAEPEDGLAATAKLLFDATVTEHLDIESILFMSERIRELLCEDAP